MRFAGFTREEMAEMTDTERWRKAFSALGLVEEMVSGLLGGSESAPEATSTGMPALNIPRGVDPMAAYNVGPDSTDL